VKIAAAILLVSLSACGPSDEQVAQQCGVSVADLKQTKSAVSSMQPYQGAELGKCSVIKDDSGVDVIDPQSKRRADLMVKEEGVLNGIADRCGTPRTVWRVVSADQVQLVPERTSPKQVDCLLNEFGKAKLPVNLGFIGREDGGMKKQ
jgi:hypothetical protein